MHDRASDADNGRETAEHGGEIAEHGAGIAEHGAEVSDDGVETSNNAGKDAEGNSVIAEGFRAAQHDGGGYLDGARNFLNDVPGASRNTGPSWRLDGPVAGVVPAIAYDANCDGWLAGAIACIGNAATLCDGHDKRRTVGADVRAPADGCRVSDIARFGDLFSHRRTAADRIAARCDRRRSAA